MRLPAAAWTPAYDGDGQVRDGAWVAELTGLLNLTSWPKGMRVIIRKERPTPARNCGSPTRRPPFTAFAASTRTGQLADLELRHRRRARCEDRTLRQRHRPALPAAARIRPEPDLVPDRRPRLRTARLDGNARPARYRTPLGTRAKQATAAIGHRADRRRQPPPPPAHRHPVAMGQRHHHRNQPPASTRTRLTETRHPYDTEQLRARGTPPTRHDSRVTSEGPRPKRRRGRRPRPRTQDHERPRLVRAVVISIHDTPHRVRNGL
jgi:hypothetical protein